MRSCQTGRDWAHPSAVSITQGPSSYSRASESSANKTLMSDSLPMRRYGISWGAIGALEDCISRTREYALERYQFKRPLASFQLVQKKLVEAHTEATLGLLASLQVRNYSCITCLQRHSQHILFIVYPGRTVERCRQSCA